MSDQYESELSRRTEEKVAGAIKKGAAIMSGAWRGVITALEDLPWWAKLKKALLVMAGILIVLVLLGGIYDEYAVKWGWVR